MTLHAPKQERILCFFQLELFKRRLIFETKQKKYAGLDGCSDYNFYLDEEHHYSSMDMSIATGKYYYDLEVKDVSTSVDDGVREFFRKTGAHF